MEDSVMNMDYKELRKQLKSKRLSAAGKKTELQQRLIQHLASETFTIEEEKDEEAVEEMETSSPIAKNVSISHEKTPTNQVSLVLDDDTSENVDEDHSFHVKARMSAARSTTRKSLRKSTNEMVERLLDAPATPEPQQVREKTPSRLKTPTRFRDHFAKIHERQNEKMESIQDHQDKVLKRHQELTQDCPSSIKRLATPKSVKKRQPLKVWKETDPKNMTFKFGEDKVDDFKNVVQPKSQTPTSVRKTAKREQRDVKQVTRAGYTPHTKSARKKFIDTTKLSDREYELAVEEGYITGNPGRGSSIKRRVDSKKRRDDVLALKRKLNIE